MKLLLHTVHVCGAFVGDVVAPVAAGGTVAAAAVGGVEALVRGVVVIGADRTRTDLQCAAETRAPMRALELIRMRRRGRHTRGIIINSFVKKKSTSTTMTLTFTTVRVVARPTPSVP